MGLSHRLVDISLKRYVRKMYTVILTFMFTRLVLHRPKLNSSE
jgi:hypothetical protein